MLISRVTLIIAILSILLVALAVSSSNFGEIASNSDNVTKQDALIGANEAGMNIYRMSEWANNRSASTRSNEEGLAIYFASERNTALVGSAVSSQEGMAIYHKSERHAAETPAQRLYNGEPLNAYQRSEWLGEEQ